MADLISAGSRKFNRESFVSAGIGASDISVVFYLAVRQIATHNDRRPSDGGAPVVRIGLVGVGFMGWIHYLAYQHLKGAKLAAVSSRDQAKLAGDWRSIRGNFGPPGEQVDLSGVKTYE